VAVTVTPETFSYVAFDAELIRRVATDLAGSIGLTDAQIAIEVDETTPLARTVITIDDPTHLRIRADSGAFEDTRKPRQQSEVATATALGRVLLRAYDRLHGGFGEAPPDAELTLPQIAAWETYCIGRLERLGIPTNRQRWLYNFRNRHGFTNAGDAAFDALWAGESITWGSLVALSDGARTTQEATP
jgi:hypothetical protein